MTAHITIAATKKTVLFVANTLIAQPSSDNNARKGLEVTVWSGRSRGRCLPNKLGDRHRKLNSGYSIEVDRGVVANAVAVVAYSPFGHGRLPTKRTEGGRVLHEIAAAHHATPRQVALAFLLRGKSVFAIPKASDPDHAAENAGAGDLRLSASEINRLDEVFPRGRHPKELPTL